MMIARNAIAPKVRTNFDSLDDVALVEAMLRRDEAAWTAFTRRFERLLREQVGTILNNAMLHVLDSDAVDDVIGDLHLLLVERDMRKLRVWLNGPRTASLGRWLVILASGIAMDHIRAAFRHQAATVVPLQDEDEDPDRVDRFSATDHSLTVPRMRVEDEDRVYVWYGDDFISVYAEDGRQIDHIPIGVGWSYTPTPSKVRAAIDRHIQRVTGKRPKRAR